VRLRLAAAVAALAVAPAGCGGGGDGDDERSQAADTVQRTTRVEVVEQQGDEGAFDARSIYRRAGPGVVTIISVFPSSGGGGIGGLFGPRDEPPDGGDEPQGGLGSGFVVDEDGEIATNAHVVT